MSDDPTIAESIDDFCAETGRTREQIRDDRSVRREWRQWVGRFIPIGSDDPVVIAEAQKLLKEAGGQWVLDAIDEAMGPVG